MDLLRRLPMMSKWKEDKDEPGLQRGGPKLWGIWMGSDGKWSFPLREEVVGRHWGAGAWAAGRCRRRRVAVRWATADGAAVHGLWLSSAALCAYWIRGRIVHPEWRCYWEHLKRYWDKTIPVNGRSSRSYFPASERLVTAWPEKCGEESQLTTQLFHSIPHSVPKRKQISTQSHRNVVLPYWIWEKLTFGAQCILTIFWPLSDIFYFLTLEKEHCGLIFFLTLLSSISVD